MQNDYINDYNKEHYKQITIRVSPEEADEIKATATKARKSIKQLIISAVRLYARSLTAAETATPDTAPDKISPETVTGAETQPTETQAETHTEKPEEDKQDKPQDSPQDAHSKPQDGNKVSPEQIPLDDFEQAVLNAYRKAYKQAREDIKIQQQAQAIAKQFKGIPKRTSRTKIQARRRPKAYKG